MKHVFFAVVLLLLIAQPTIARQGRDTRRAPVGHDVLTKRNLVYAKVGPSKQPLKLDLYLPKGRRKLPFLIIFHGGGLTKGDKAAMKRIAERFAMEGFGVAAPNYRLAPESPYPAFIEDAAIKELKDRTHNTIAPNLPRKGDEALVTMLEFLRRHGAANHPLDP